MSYYLCNTYVLLSLCMQSKNICIGSLFNKSKSNIFSMNIACKIAVLIVVIIGGHHTNFKNMKETHFFNF